MTDREELPPFQFAGLRFAHLDSAGAVDWISRHADLGQAVVVVTPNINHLHLVQRSAPARDVVDRADIQLADGWPIVAASRLLGTPLPGRIAGIDLVDRLLSSERSFSLAILGGPADAASRLAARAAAHNEVVLVDELQPGWDAPEARAQLRTRLADARPDLTLVGIGAPRQEVLAHELRPHVRGPIVCCGAAIEVLAGIRPRAPLELQRLGLEWAWRLAIEPRRLAGRYLLGGANFLRLLARELRARRQRASARL